jgi:hypothetical protein
MSKGWTRSASRPPHDPRRDGAAPESWRQAIGSVVPMSMSYVDILDELDSDERFDGVGIGRGTEPVEGDTPQQRGLVPVIRIEEASPEQEAQLADYAESRGLTVQSLGPGRLLLREPTA